MSDCLVVGGGVIGLSLAYELAGHGLRVRLIDSGQPGQEASWAGAGILPPASSIGNQPLAQLTELSNQLHAQWSQELRASTAIDNGYRRCGGLYLLHEWEDAERFERGVGGPRNGGPWAQRLTPQALSQLEPALQPREVPRSVFLVSDECQIRSPRHLQALVAGALGRGVRIDPCVVANDFDIRGGRVVAVRTTAGDLQAGRVVVTAGSWTGALAGKLGVSPAIRPVRGQIVLLKLPCRLLQRIVNVGNRYLVPRDDGRLLVGSTEEEVGFDRRTTAAAICDLLSFASGLAPQLDAAELERSWAGLRPSNADGLPYLGRVPGLENAFVAAGHFRGGLQLSTATAVVMGQLVRGRPTSVDLSAFRVDRDDADRPRDTSASQRRRREVGSTGRDQ